MVIDGHAHAAREYATLETLCDMLRRNHVDKVILCPSLKNTTDLSDPPGIFQPKHGTTPERLYASNKWIRFTFRWLRDKGDGNRFVHALVTKCPETILQFYWVDMRTDRLSEVLPISFEEMAYAGLKLHQAWTPFDMTGEKFHAVVEFAAQTQLPLFLHPYSPRDTAALAEIATSNRTVNFIVAHLLGESVFADKHLDNVFHDLSPHYLCQASLAHAVNVYGAEKLIFGSDMPFGKLDQGLQNILALKIRDEEKEKILGQNMAQLLHLEESNHPL